MTSFVFNTTKSLIFESGAAACLADHCAASLSGNCFFITDPTLRELGLCDGAIASLESAGMTVNVFSDVEADPSLATVLAAVEAAKASNSTCVVGFGGGSSLDVSKLVALLVASDQDLNDAWGVGNAKGPRLPLVAVPTTAGTGSEVTPISIVTVSEEEKRGVSSPIILPDIAVLDPDLTLSLPPHVTAATGVDAMVHAIEAYASKNPNNNPVSKLLACEALRLLGANIETAVHHGNDLQARSAMLLGSMLAGQAFANSPIAAVHALAYPIGSTFHVSHGLSNTLVLPHVLRFNAPNAADSYSEIAPNVFPALADVEHGPARCGAFIDELGSLSKRLGLQTKLRDVGIPRDALSKMAADAMLQTRLLVNNPRELSESDAFEIYTSAW